MIDCEILANSKHYGQLRSDFVSIMVSWYWYNLQYSQNQDNNMVYLF